MIRMYTTMNIANEQKMIFLLRQKSGDYELIKIEEENDVLKFWNQKG